MEISFGHPEVDDVTVIKAQTIMINFGLMLYAIFFFSQKPMPAETMTIVHLHIWQNWLKTDCYQLAVNSLHISKDEWPPNSSDLNPLDYRAWGNCSSATLKPKQGKLTGSRKSCSWYDMTFCHRAASSEPIYLLKNTGLVWMLVVVDTLNICLKGNSRLKKLYLKMNIYV